MDLTARYVADSRSVIAQVEAADYTDPDMPRQQIAVLITRLTETLRTMSDHAERLQRSHDQRGTENAELEGQVRALHAALAEPTAA